MDPVTIATTALAVLTPYLAKGGETLASELSKQGLAKGEAVLQALWARWRGKPQAEARLASFVADPAAGRDAMSAALAVEATADPDFAAALDAMLKGGPADVFIEQAVGKAGEITGAQIREMLSGRVQVRQTVEEATKVVGVAIDRLGGGRA